MSQNVKAKWHKPGLLKEFIYEITELLTVVRNIGFILALVLKQ